MKSLIKYPITGNRMINTFIEAVHDTELIYTCKDLYNAGILGHENILNAIKRGTQALHRSGINPEYHIKHIYITDLKSGVIIQDWKLSKLGLLVIFLSADSDNDIYNRLKIDIIKRIQI